MTSELICKSTAAFPNQGSNVLLLNLEATIYEEHLNISLKHTYLENKSFWGKNTLWKKEATLLSYGTKSASE
jgi:hypothetical protein